MPAAEASRLYAGISKHPRSPFFHCGLGGPAAALVNGSGQRLTWPAGKEAARIIQVTDYSLCGNWDRKAADHLIPADAWAIPCPHAHPRALAQGRSFCEGYIVVIPTGKARAKRVRL